MNKFKYCTGSQDLVNKIKEKLNKQDGQETIHENNQIHQIDTILVEYDYIPENYVQLQRTSSGKNQDHVAHHHPAENLDEHPDSKQYAWYPSTVTNIEKKI